MYITVSNIRGGGTRLTRFLFVKNCPTGPQMWMEIQRGEGPKALPLQGPVILGETLTMVFTLADDVFRFDSTVLNCWASDGKIYCSLIIILARH